MAIVQETISQQVNALVEQTKTLEQEQSQAAFADGLAAIIATAIASAQVIIPIGGVVVAGSAVTQTNPAPVIGTLQ